MLSVLRVDFVGGRQYEQVLGMRLRAIFPMHGVAGANRKEWRIETTWSEWYRA